MLGEVSFFCECMEEFKAIMHGMMVMAYKSLYIAEFLNLLLECI